MKHLVLILGTIVLFWGTVVVRAASVQVSVSATADDCYVDHKYSGAPWDSTIYTNDVTNYMGKYNASIKQDAGYRFVAVAVANGVTIDSAWITFYSAGTTAGSANKYAIYGEDTASAATFSTLANWAGRIKTTAHGDTTIGAWTAGVSYRSPSLTSVVAEQTSRVDWTSGGNLAYLVLEDSSGGTAAGNRAQSYENVGTNPAVLNIWYTAGGSPTTTRRRRAGLWLWPRADEQEQFAIEIKEREKCVAP